MDSTTPDSSEDKGLTYSTQQYVAAKPSTAATQVDPRRSSHHARRSSVAELTGDNVKNEDEKKTFEEQMQTAAVDRVGVVGDAVKGSKGHISPAKTTNTAKAIKEPKYYGTYLVPGINTEKRQYNAEDENED